MSTITFNNRQPAAATKGRVTAAFGIATDDPYTVYGADLLSWSTEEIAGPPMIACADRDLPRIYRGPEDQQKWNAIDRRVVSRDRLAKLARSFTPPSDWTDYPEDF